MSYTETTISSEIHRLWSAISCVAGALERRVWVRAGDMISYPNLYVILVAPPGSGKQIIDTVQDLWAHTPKKDTEEEAFFIGSDSATRAAMIDDLAKARKTYLPPTGPILVYHSLLVAAEEFEVLLPSYEPDFISRLNRLWNCPARHKETRRYGHAQLVEFVNPCLNILAGAPPAYFTAHFPDEAWNTGLIRRIILVYSSAAPLKDIFARTPDRSLLRHHLISTLTRMSLMYGEASWGKDSWKTIQRWHLEGENPVPQHSKLEYYSRSRAHFLLKLSLISAVARTGAMTIEAEDVTRAMLWLFEAEKVMPDIFRAMAGKSDHQIIEELWYYMNALFKRDEGKPIHTSVLKQFLLIRVPHDKVDSLIRVAEGADIIARRAGETDLWVPRAKHLHGME